jgi:hypothetical protein
MRFPLFLIILFALFVESDARSQGLLLRSRARRSRRRRALTRLNMKQPTNTTTNATFYNQTVIREL